MQKTDRQQENGIFINSILFPGMTRAWRTGRYSAGPACPAAGFRSCRETIPRAKAFVARRGYAWDADCNAASATCSAAALAAPKLPAVLLATKVGRAFFPMDR
jgi:hypothetical protein